MGHRMEVYTDADTAQEVIAHAKSFNIEAQVVGRVEASETRELHIESEFGSFRYE
jgi:phosphoribosylformylglycinamidine cyclo-ligase